MEKSDPNPGRNPPKASTADVLGTKSATPQEIDPRWDKQYHKLSALRDSLVRRQNDLLSQAAEESTPPQRNIADLGTDDYNRDLALGMASSEQELLYEIDEAMNRIRAGTYGVCEQTGQPIEPERLEAVPWTRFSAEAERTLEAHGQTPRVKIGDLETRPPE